MYTIFIVTFVDLTIRIFGSPFATIIFGTVCRLFALRKELEGNLLFLLLLSHCSYNIIIHIII